MIGNCPTLLTLGYFLCEMNEYKKAEKYYRLLLKELPEDHELIPEIYNNIGCIRMEIGDEPIALEYLQRALHSQQNKFLLLAAISNCVMCSSHNNDGHEISTDISDSIHELDVITKALSVTSLLLPKVLNNMGLLYHRKNDYLKARDLYDQALKALLCSEIRYPPDISVVYNNKAAVEYSCKNYEKACEYYELAIKIGKEFWIDTDPIIIEYNDNLATARRKII
ncbi:unnamed protein product [Didymodactylos carnosus]|uniref:Tetratricopeptide repeat protein n=1 Tax=Didymodactylos carnosus TaxID=1234261 RepID=A0A8S2DCD3_9BILA|nr:unnamed protein product [Didymodactylos carnosus]CAF3710086.1 unnamed protein product [Didymodactylos carnosus]